MTTTKSLQIETADKLLNRLRDIYKNTKVTKSKLHRQRLELYTTTYLYMERRQTDDNMLNAVDVYRELSESIGGSSPCWCAYHRAGLFLRNNRLDLDNVKVGALNLALRFTLDAKTLPKVVKALSNGCDHKKMANILADSGCATWRKIPEWRKKEIRQAKKSWPDWQPELDSLINAIALTSDGNYRVGLTLTVNGKKVAATSRKTGN